MAVFAVVNRKGGSGKSTLATHVAAWLARQGVEVMLGDVDRLQSSRLWLSMRAPELPRIQGWSIDERNFARPPAGVKHVVLDTPGGFQGIGLMKVAMYADAIILPMSPALFDRTAAMESLRELRTYPRVATGKCRLATLGMRIDRRTKQAEALAAWAQSQGVDFLGTIRATQSYATWLESGVTLFDQRADKVAAALEDWQGVTACLQGVLESVEMQAMEQSRRLLPPTAERSAGVSSAFPPPSFLQR